MTHWKGFLKKNSVYVIWLSGLVLGILLAHGSKTLIAPNIRGDIFMPVTSPASLLITAFIPVVISFVLIYFHKRNLLLITLLIRACITSYSMVWISFMQWGNTFALLFFQFLSSNCSSCFLVYLALQSRDVEPGRVRSSCSIMCMTLVIVCLLDYLSSCLLIS